MLTLEPCMEVTDDGMDFLCILGEQSWQRQIEVRIDFPIMFPTATAGELQRLDAGLASG